MSKNKAIILSIIGVVVFIAIVSAVSYAYYTRTFEEKNESNNNVNVTTAQLELKFQDNDNENLDLKIVPGKTIEKKFKVINSGSATNFKIVVDELTNNFIRPEDITYVVKEDGVLVDGASGTFPSSVADNELSGVITISAGESREYSVSITYNNDPDNDQTPDMGHSIGGKIFIKTV